MVDSAGAMYLRGYSLVRGSGFRSGAYGVYDKHTWECNYKSGAFGLRIVESW